MLPTAAVRYCSGGALFGFDGVMHNFRPEVFGIKLYPLTGIRSRKGGVNRIN